MNLIHEIISCLPQEIAEALTNVDETVLNKVTEIRIRRLKKVVLVVRNSSYFVDSNGDLYDFPSSTSLKVGEELFDKIFYSLCDYSVYNNMDSLINGYITLKCGARVGVTGTAVIKDGCVCSVKDISSLNIRVPNQVTGCSLPLLNFLYINSFPSIIVAGEPNSGKTTLLRDMTRELSGGFNNKYCKITVVDERNEICGKCNDSFTMELGENTDVITGYPKSKAIENAIRTMSPELIVCDEISTVAELEAIKDGFSAGVSFALSIHCRDFEDLVNKPIVKALLEVKEFSYIVLLNEHSYKYEIIDAAEVYNEICRNNRADNIIDRLGIRIV